MVLTGVASGGRAAIAIIADAGAGGRESAYRIGDQIRAGVTLVEVSRNGAVVARGDMRERLPLTRSVKTENPRPGDSEASSLRVDSPMVAAGSGHGVAGRSPLRRRNFAPEVLRQGAMVPDPAGGFQMKKVMPDSLYSKLGLRAGDVLRSVNGAPIDSPEQLTALYRQLSEGGQGQVEVLREGRPEALRYGGS
jgi:type II secretory pathway component PulC